MRDSTRCSAPSVVAALGLAALLGACSPTEPPPPTAPGMAPQTDFATGEALFDENCSACHGPSGRGPSLQALKALSDEELRAAIVNHPQAGEVPNRLPAAEISDLIEFLEN